MNIFSMMKEHVVASIDALAAMGSLPPGLETGRIAVEPPREASHGDMATNAAMVLAKSASMKPRDLAEKLGQKLLECEGVSEIEIAGPGFINIRLDAFLWRDCLKNVLQQGVSFGTSTMGAGEQVNVEYVSANPTGPLHIGHARGAVFGDVLATLLQKAGYRVCREYYINDAGTQVDVLARSAYLRYREVRGEVIGDIPEGLYPGVYLKAVGRVLSERHGDRLMTLPEAEWLEAVRETAVTEMMTLIRSDLSVLGVKLDLFTSEQSLVAAGEVDACLQDLEDRSLIYEGVLEPPKGKKPEDWEARPQTLFKAIEFGDDLDRPLKKSDGSWTYFASDIAYHRDKYKRGFTNQIDVWGADHGGYVKRMQAAVNAVTEGNAALDVKICQLVKLMDKGEPVKMSKRSGNFVTLRNLVDEVGKDVVRFIMLTRKNDASLDFDLTAVTEQSRDNPVWYVQYAHARCNSIRRMVETQMPDLNIGDKALANAALERLSDDSELALMRLMASWPRMVEAAAEAHEPHRIAFYLSELASAFHSHWNRGKDDRGLRFIVEDDREVTVARFALVRAVQNVVASGLAVFGIEPVEEMR
ncbi:MAG: arginine--tRNA ligase [Alphaproteobacteria bacterium]